MQLNYSFIIPVYNRPEEIQELLDSLAALRTANKFEVVIVEDGSSKPSKAIVDDFKDRLNISYYFKENSGPGDSRNYGMKRAQGNYFIILDSDCILPENYLIEVHNELINEYADCFGGPDEAHESFTNLQKAINFSMTSFITTGGIRGHSNSVNKFQPRSFNMGLSKAAFEASNGFGSIHPGEDPDLSIRLWKLGYQTKFIPRAVVYHKRRVSWGKFYKQVQKFGLVRPILNQWHPSTKSITYWFPTFFVSGFVLGLLFLFIGYKWFILLYMVYFIVAFIIALATTKSLVVSFWSMVAIGVQFVGYGYGFLKSTIALHFFNKDPKTYFPDLFFNKV
ncbi:glycosyltransferase [Aestuariivivens sediminis]|uniref:glycosyltransferase n=1 Tax=Aestuariivivens sediminis TaxID=2913557 RepID=UPI001F587CF7|nr:glycosyltransferase [Aestuariivivens sediminis]